MILLNRILIVVIILILFLFLSSIIKYESKILHTGTRMYKGLKMEGRKRFGSRNCALKREGEGVRGRISLCSNFHD